MKDTKTALEIICSAITQVISTYYEKQLDKVTVQRYCSVVVERKNMQQKITVAMLETMSLEELIGVARTFHDFKVKTNQKPILKLFLAHHIQKTYKGGLLNKEIEELRRLSNIKNNEDCEKNMIHKVWKGNVYSVERLKNGTFFFRGDYYKTLTAVATAITGRKVSGNRFFNLEGK